MTISREQFLKPLELKTIEFEVEGLGKVRMRELSGSEMTSKVTNWTRPNGKLCKERQAKSSCKLVVECLVDESDEKVLTEDDVDLISEYPSSIQRCLIEAAFKLNGMIKADDEVTEDLRGKSDS